MFKHDHVVSIQKNLLAGKYFQALEDLRNIGHPIKKAWYDYCLKEKNEISINKFTVNSRFKKFLVDNINDSQFSAENNDKTIQQLYDLKNTLSQLTLVLMVWKDNPKSKLEQLNLSNADKKKLRQQLKYKTHLDKEDRYDINIGFQAVIFILCQQINNAIKQNSAHDSVDLKDISQFKETLGKDDLIHFIFSQQENLNNVLSKNLNSNNEPVLFESNPQITEKIGEAIATFQTPTKKKKVLKYSGVAFAFIAALASGISTGAVIILLFPSLSFTAITLGVLITLFGFMANFRFLSKNFPDFLLSLIKKGGITEYIDQDGNRKQFSTLYKYLLTPLAIFASLTVGVGTTALTYITIFGLVAKFLPILAIIWPPLPFILVGILAVSIGITLTVATLTASLELLKKPASLNMSFLQLCQFTYKNCIEWFKQLKHAKTHEKVGLVIMLLLLPVGLGGLAYYRYTAGVDLSIFIGLAGAIVTGLVAYMAQMAFIFLSINKLKNAIIRPFSSEPIQPESANSHSSRLLNRLHSFFSKIWDPLVLGINAIGNSILVYNGSPLSIAGAVACGVNSFSGNMLAPDIHHVQRKQINQFINQEYETFITKTKLNNENPLLVSDHNTQPSTTNKPSPHTFFFNLPEEKTEIRPTPHEANVSSNRCSFYL
ncbi:hypothetical protein [Rickettsiella grylli]|uniref:Membrane protein n=1 Tax=Rickettsiella grylli TaxID=59196 RepID=A8PMI3_9COXI|nr:hypothetical protein [Rickettsiella grylli]EDP46654.1 putative membrane protein [Rickettsiella grylli]